MSKATTHPEIAAVCDAKRVKDQAEVALLQTILAWTAAHRVDRELVDELTFGENGVLLGGIGCPLVREFDVYDLAAQLDMSSTAGCHYVGRVLELRYRLPKTWEQVLALAVPVWKALKLADSTMNLTFEAARYIDTMLAPTLARVSLAQIERTLAMAIDLHDPDEAEKRRQKAADVRGFEVHLNGQNAPLPCDGTTTNIDVSGTLSLEDALDLEAAVQAGATALADLGSEESLNARRAKAVGDMARTQLALDLTSTDSGGESGGVAPAGRGVTIYAHLDPDSEHATLDNTGAGDVLIEQIKDWCQTAGTTVIVKPVIDLNTDLSTDAYTPTEKIAEQVRLRDQTCVFPDCTRRGRFCDLDHRVPFDHDNPGAGGKTTTSNLALLCRRHHRTKTFSTWTYESPRPGVYEWTSPSGARFRVVRGRRQGRMPVTTRLSLELET